MNWLIGVVIFFTLALPASAKVILNEVSPRTDPEWVELYNDGDTAVDLTGYKLVDKAGNTESIATLGAIPATSYLVYTRAKGWLNDTSEEFLFLYDQSGTLLDSVSYTSIKEGQTIARIPSVVGSWFTDQSPSLGFANPTPSPSPIPSPSPSSLPTPLPSPSPPPTPGGANTPTPSPSPLPTTPTPPSTPSPSPLSASPKGSGGVVLAAIGVGTPSASQPEIDLAIYGQSPVPTHAPESPPLPRLQLDQGRARLVLSLGAGLVCIGLAGYLGYRAYLARQRTAGE